MTRRSTVALLIMTHVLALGLGIVLVQRPGEAGPSSRDRPALKRSDQAERAKSRVSTEDLLAAHRDFKLVSEAREKRQGSEKTTTSPPQSTKLSPEERAAAIKDITASLDKELDAVNRGKSYDYMLSKALVKRWVLEDPAACMKWIGSMKMQVGWGDPFNALAEALPAEELLDLMDEGWLSRNRSRALESMAKELGNSSPAELATVVSKLNEKEASRFISDAIRNSQPQDAEVWLTFALEHQPELVRTLATEWLGSGFPSWEWKDGELVESASRRINSTGSWMENAQVVLSAAEGTAAERQIRTRYDLALVRIEEERLKALATREPNRAYEELMTLYESSGRSAKRVRQDAIKTITDQFANHADQWRQSEWELALQQSILGELTVDRVISDRFEQIRAEIPESFRAPLQEKALADGFRVDPSATIRLGMEQGMKDGLIMAAGKTFSETGQPFSVKAGVMLELDRAGLWQVDARKLHQHFAHDANEFLVADPEAAQAWKSQFSPDALRTLNLQAR